MRTSAITAVAAASVIAVAGCSGGDSPEASAGPTATPTVTVTTTAQPEDVAGRGNCISAGLAYAPIKSGLDGATDLESAVGFFSAPDVDPVTSDAGKASAVAIAEMNLELALANADVLTGQPLDEARLRQLMDAVDKACAPLV